MNYDVIPILYFFACINYTKLLSVIKHVIFRSVDQCFISTHSSNAKFIKPSIDFNAFKNLNINNK
jgi:hypothetical protein